MQTIYKEVGQNYIQIRVNLMRIFIMKPQLILKLLTNISNLMAIFKWNQG